MIWLMSWTDLNTAHKFKLGFMKTIHGYMISLASLKYPNKFICSRAHFGLYGFLFFVVYFFKTIDFKGLGN